MKPAQQAGADTMTTTSREAETDLLRTIYATYGAEAPAHIAAMQAAVDSATAIQRAADYVPVWIAARDPAWQAKGRQLASESAAKAQAWQTANAAVLEVARVVAPAPRRLRSGLGRDADETIEDLRFAAVDLCAIAAHLERAIGEWTKAAAV